MRENMKKRLAVFLSILFILPTIMSVLPMTSQEVQAGVTYMGWTMTKSPILNCCPASTAITLLDPE